MGAVEAILDGRTTSQSRQSRRKHRFTLAGLVRCGHGGCLTVGELKKGRYVYDHCTERPARFDDPYVREEGSSWPRWHAPSSSS